MAKGHEIPAENSKSKSGPGPNSATRTDVDRVAARIKRLGMDFHEAIEAAKLGRATGFRLLKNPPEASVGKLRELEEWVLKEERRRSVNPAPTSADGELLLQEWNELGARLRAANEAQFLDTLDGLRGFVDAHETIAQSIRKMFRATPER